MKYFTVVQIAYLVGTALGASIPNLDSITARENETLGITGINCRGSSECGTNTAAGDTLRELRGFLNGINPDRWYDDGEQIACLRHEFEGHGFCVFLQGTAGSPGRAIAPLVDALLGHGCGLCGSAPYLYVQGVNDATNVGWLTVNYVWDARCHHLC